ncbi:MAG TPA: anti-virulence regulator CigR family protein [Gemmatimonadales bacterium]|jgi:hypothetical protein|nr:anti-virulence regulator CigR family protein [Gemmatimonadales bacterium]
MSKSGQFVLIAALLVAATAQASAQRPDKAKGPKDQPTVRVVFHDSDRGVFREYYRAHRDAVKPLPPGIAKNLARGKPIPPGIAKTRVPEAVLVRLPWRPAGYTFFLVGDRVVLVDGNGLVADILVSIF